MLKKLGLHNSGIAGGLLLALSSICSLFAPPTANAASAYDNLVHPVSNIVAGNTTECPLERDFSTNWYSQILDDNNLYSGGQSARANVRAAIAEALDEEEGIAIIQVNASGAKYVAIFATVPSANSTVTFSSAYGYQHLNMTNVIKVQIQMVDSNGQCVPHLDYNDSQATRDVVFSQFSGIHTQQPFFINNNITYPIDYEGYSVPSLSTPPITGNVQCANSSNIISNVHINTQSGIDGNATISDDGIGGKNYRFHLSEPSPYSLVVACDGDFFYGPTVETDLYSTYNWVCVPTTPGQNPLNICAAS